MPKKGLRLEERREKSSLEIVQYESGNCSAYRGTNSRTTYDSAYRSAYRNTNRSAYACAYRNPYRCAYRTTYLISNGNSHGESKSADITVEYQRWVLPY